MSGAGMAGAGMSSSGMSGGQAAGAIRVPPPAFLFDLDGTLVDSVYQHVSAWDEALTLCGIHCLSGGYTGGSA